MMDQVALVDAKLQMHPGLVTAISPQHRAVQRAARLL